MSSKLTLLLTKFQHKIKMNQGRVSANYARALFGWANDQGLASEVYKQSIAMIEFANQDPEFIQLLNSRGVSVSKKQSICNMVTSNISPNLGEIISLHIKNGRESNFILTLLQYQKIYRKHNGIEKVVVVSPSELNAKLVSSIKDFLHIKLSKSIEIEQAVDPNLIGGFTLTIGDNYLDKSVRGELELLRKQLLGII